MPNYFSSIVTVSIWDYGYGGSLWVHTNAIINIIPGSSASNTSITIQTTKGKLVPINVFPSGRLVVVDNCWSNSWFIPTSSVTTEGLRDSYRELLRTSSFDQQ